jgi:hypothetical protein
MSDEADDVAVRAGWAPDPSSVERSTPGAAHPRSTPAGHHSQARSGRTSSLSSGSTTTDPAP